MVIGGRRRHAGTREMMRVLVLSVIAAGEAHGYEIRDRITRLTEGLVRPSPGVLYPLLFILRREGLIEVSREDTGGRRKRVYRLTSRGREYLVPRLAVMARVLRRVADFMERIRESLEKGEGAADAYRDMLLREREALLALKERIERELETIDRLVGKRP